VIIAFAALAFVGAVSSRDSASLKGILLGWKALPTFLMSSERWD
jgi:hypothetical protein